MVLFCVFVVFRVRPVRGFVVVLVLAGLRRVWRFVIMPMFARFLVGSNLRVHKEQ
jgi:hypothetical protein